MWHTRRGSRLRLRPYRTGARREETEGQREAQNGAQLSDRSVGAAAGREITRQRASAAQGAISDG